MKSVSRKSRAAKPRPSLLWRRRTVFMGVFLLALAYSLFRFSHPAGADQKIITGDTVKTQSQETQPQDSIIEHLVQLEGGSTAAADDADANYVRANATFFSLARNSDLEGLLASIHSVEQRFNSKFHYDWVFANEEDFTAEFMQLTADAVSGEPKYVKIPPEFWGYPPWIDQDLAGEVRDQMEHDGVKYGGSESYRHMCRFNSGFFYKLPVMKQYKYYWRVEPDVSFSCNIDYDLFKYMEEHKKKYAFTLAPYEIHTTVLSLWDVVTNFTHDYPQHVAKNNNYEFLTDDMGESFNMCHFWSNFEVADMDFYRSEPYEDFFEYMDLSAGFYYERWGDAPIHTMAVALLLDKKDVYYAANTGYFHSPNGDCPLDDTIRADLQCDCDESEDTTWKFNSCVSLYFEVNDLELPPAVSHLQNLKTHREGSVNSNPIVNSGYRVVS